MPLLLQVLQAVDSCSPVLKAMQRRNALAALHSAKVRAALGVARDVCHPVPVCTRSLAAVSGAVCRGVGEWTPGRVWRH